VILFFYSPDGWEEWGLSARPLIRDRMPVLIDDDLKFEDDDGTPRPTVAINRWLRELPISGAPSPQSWKTYARPLKQWCEFLASHGVHVFADRRELRGVLSLYAEHRLSGPLDVRLEGSSWNQAVGILSAFYRWAAAEGYVAGAPFTYAQRNVIRPDGRRVTVETNRAKVRGVHSAHATRKYLEREYRDLLMNALAGNDPNGEPDDFRGRETGRNAAGAALAFSSGLRSQEWTYLTVYEVPALPRQRTDVPVPLALAPPTTKGSKGRTSWIDYDDLARVWDYIELERAAAVDGSRWTPANALHVEGPDYDGAHINGVRRRWHTLTPAERLRLVTPQGGSALLAVQSTGAPFVDWATVLRRTAARIQERYDRGFPHVHPHVTRHTFAMHTLERLVRGYYQQAAQLVTDTGGDDAMALYLTRADPLLVLRDLLGHSSVATTQVYLHLLDTRRIYREAYEAADPSAVAATEAAGEFEEV